MDDPWYATRGRFAEGLAPVASLLESHGFTQIGSEVGKGSGGPFAEATFARDGRSVTFWLRGDSPTSR